MLTMHRALVSIGLLVGLFAVVGVISALVNWISIKRYYKRVSQRKFGEPATKYTRTDIRSGQIARWYGVVLKEAFNIVMAGLESFASKCIRASAKRKIDFVEVVGVNEITISKAGKGSFFWQHETVDFGARLNFRRLQQNGPFADIWYLELPGGPHHGGLARNDAGDVLFTHGELMGFAQKLNGEAPERILPGVGADARYGSHWSIDLNRGIEFSLMTPGVGSVHRIWAKISAGKSQIGYGPGLNAWGNGEEISNTELLERLREMFRDAEQRIPELSAVVQKQRDDREEAERRHQDELREQGLRS